MYVHSLIAPYRGLYSFVPSYGFHLAIKEIQTLDGCVLPTSASAIEELYDWSLNFSDHNNPWSIFCDLIGYSQDAYGQALSDSSKYDDFLGYIELCKLANALSLFENHGHSQVCQWIEMMHSSRD